MMVVAEDEGKKFNEMSLEPRTFYLHLAVFIPCQRQRRESYDRYVCARAVLSQTTLAA